MTAGAEVLTKDYEGADPLGFVISLNLHRRHLNESQRAMVAADIATLGHGGDRVSDQAANLPVATQAEAAAMLNPFRFVWQIHDARRHWQSQEQRHACWTLCAISMAKWQQEAERIREEANAKRSEAAKAQHAVSNPRAGETVSGEHTNGVRTKTKASTNAGSKAKAESSGTNRGAVPAQRRRPQTAATSSQPRMPKV